MSDKYGDPAPEAGNTGHDAGQDTDFGLVPRGPFKGRPWEEVPALTLHNVLNAVDFGVIEMDQRRVVAIREGLRKKDHPSPEASAYAEATADETGGKSEGGAQG